MDGVEPVTGQGNDLRNQSIEKWTDSGLAAVGAQPCSGQGLVRMRVLLSLSLQLCIQTEPGTVRSHMQACF